MLRRRPSLARRTAAGWSWEGRRRRERDGGTGRKEGRKEGRSEGEKREKKEDLWHCGGGGRRGKRSSIILASTDGERDGGRADGRSALHRARQGGARTDAEADGRTSGHSSNRAAPRVSRSVCRCLAAAAAAALTYYSECDAGRQKGANSPCMDTGK